MNTENKPALTAEEILKKHDYLDTDDGMVDLLAVREAMEEYAEQQTAHLKTKLQNVLKSLRLISSTPELTNRVDSEFIDGVNIGMNNIKDLCLELIQQYEND